MSNSPETFKAKCIKKSPFLGSSESEWQNGQCGKDKMLKDNRRTCEKFKHFTLE